MRQARGTEARVGSLTKEDTDAIRTMEEAMDWLLRLKAEPECPQTRLAFEAWLERDEAHRKAWQHARRTWDALGAADPRFAAPTPGLRPLPVAMAPAPRRGRAVVAGALALAAVIVLVLTLPALMIRLNADFRTDAGESRTVSLPDGSSVVLGGASAIGLDFTEDRRRVRLLAGEAYFDIAHDASRPFTVEAGAARVRVLGTAFDVALEADDTVVQLAEGRVALSGSAGPASGQEMRPGQSATLDGATGSILREDVAIDTIGAWRDGRLFVEDETVDAVVAKLARYHQAWIAVPDRGLGRQRVTGVYDLSDPDRALQALVQPFGGKVRSVSPVLRVLSRI